MTTSENPSKPKRRPRYSGKNPRRFHEKYKELNPEKYANEIEKIKMRGATPVGTHRPICVDMILQILNPQSGQTALDVTLGYGGHTSHILPKLMPNGKMFAIDQDPIERPKTQLRLQALMNEQHFPESALTIGALNFGQARQFLIEVGQPKVDMILADLGVSSMQIDDPQRGFSFKIDAPLDLRMNPNVGISAADFLAQISLAELTDILHANADEPRAQVIAKGLIAKRPRTTFEMAAVMREIMSGFSKKVQQEEGDAPIRRAFQALRIAINNEFGVLDQFLKDIPLMLNPGGRVAILSFHSGEDRRVKKSFQALQRANIYSEVSPEFIRPTPEEQRNNSRSKSAKLRWAILANN